MGGKPIADNKKMLISRPFLAGLTLALAFVGTTAGEAARLGSGNGLVPPVEIRGTVDGGAVVLAQAGDADRFNRMEETMRNLRGQIEELTHQLQLLQDQLKRMQEDVDFRFGELAPGDATVKPEQQQQQQATAPQAETDAIGSLAVDQPIANDDQLGAPPRPLGTLTLDAPPPGEQPLDLSSLATANAAAGTQPPLPSVTEPQVASIQPTGDPRSDYDQAYGLIRTGRYDAAEAAFRQFIANYPGDTLAADAQYWLGESLFARGDYSKAAEEFRAGYKAYPKSRRGPDTLLKLGLSMAGLGYRDEACQMYAATLKQYPDMSNALRQRVKNEQASASC